MEWGHYQGITAIANNVGVALAGVGTHTVQKKPVNNLQYIHGVKFKVYKNGDFVFMDDLPEISVKLEKPYKTVYSMARNGSMSRDGYYLKRAQKCKVK